MNERSLHRRNVSTVSIRDRDEYVSTSTRIVEAAGRRSRYAAIVQQQEQGGMHE